MASKRTILLVCVLAFLCVDTTLSRPVAGREAKKEAKIAEAKAKKLLASKSTANGILKAVMKHGTEIHKKHAKHAHTVHGHKKSFLLEAENGEENQLPEETTPDQSKQLVDAAEGGEMDDDSEEEEKAKKAQEHKNMIMFLIACLVTIIILGAIAYGVARMNNSSLTTASFFGLSGMSPIAVFVGMSSGLVFGIIDNAGLFFGMEYLDPFFSTLPNGDEEKVQAGYGNTFSDMIGSFLGTFCGSIVKDLAIKYGGYNEADGYPIWTEAIGITFGCIIGVLVPRAILGDPKVKRLTQAQAEALASGVTKDQIDEVMNKFDELDRTTDTERQGAVRVESLKNATPGSIDKFIAQADKEGDGDGWVTRDEILNLLTKANKKLKKAQQAIINKQDSTTDDDGKAKEKK